MDSVNPRSRGIAHSTARAASRAFMLRLPETFPVILSTVVTVSPGWMDGEGTGRTPVSRDGARRRRVFHNRLHCPARVILRYLNAPSPVMVAS